MLQDQRSAAIKKIRVRAAEILEEYGWGQNLYKSGDGPKARFCMIGACRAAVGMYGFVEDPVPDVMWMSADEQRELATAAVAEALRCSGPEAADWNDEPDRRAEEVINVLRHGRIF